MNGHIVAYKKLRRKPLTGDLDSTAQEIKGCRCLGWVHASWWVQFSTYNWCWHYVRWVCCWAGLKEISKVRFFAEEKREGSCQRSSCYLFSYKSCAWNRGRVEEWRSDRVRWSHTAIHGFQTQAQPTAMFPNVSEGATDDVKQHACKISTAYATEGPHFLVNEDLRFHSNA